MKASVTIEHQSNYPNPIFFKTGDVLKIGVYDTQYPGWIKVITDDGNEGWAPGEYISVDLENLSGKARCSYSAFELNTKLKEVLIVKLELCGWYWVQNSVGTCGWVPSETVAIE